KGTLSGAGLTFDRPQQDGRCYARRHGDVPRDALHGNAFVRSFERKVFGAAIDHDDRDIEGSGASSHKASLRSITPRQGAIDKLGAEDIGRQQSRWVLRAESKAIAEFADVLGVCAAAEQDAGDVTKANLALDFKLKQAVVVHPERKVLLAGT